MATIEEIRAALAAAMSTVPGLQAEAYARDVANVPVAMVGGPEIEYDKTFGRGHDEHTFGILLFASRASDVEGQALLDSYLDPYGESSVKAAIEADGTLGGVVIDAWVRETREYGPEDVNGVRYLYAALVVDIKADGKA